MPIQKILIANRGEIALRIMQTCRAMFIQTVAVYSEADRYAPFVQYADEAICLGAAPASESYLNQAKILEACRQSGADALHSGYGFLSENAHFAQLIQENGIIFIGPSPQAIALMGSKIRAKQIMQQNGVPVVPGYNGDNQDLNHLRQEAEKIGFPVLIKASAGGGGKGMRVVRQAADLHNALESAKREAQLSFGDDKVLLEKYFDSVRHIEFQIFGDQHGKVIHLFERECSIQRRHQKVIEEAPSTFLSADLRQKMGDSAILAGKAIAYTNAGTVEFIVDDTQNYYFLEVNTRLQVEHPVTEMITGLDLVKLQIEVAQGLPLPAIPNIEGHAIEARLYAEDPQNNFLPATGTLLHWQTPAPVRVDAGVAKGLEISTFYDPMLAKIIVKAPNRPEAVRQMSYALQQMVVLGLANNQAFLAAMMEDPDFVAGNFDTHYLERKPELIANTYLQTNERQLLLIAILLKSWANRQQQKKALPNLISGWRNNFYQPQFEVYQDTQNQKTKLEYIYSADNQFNIKINAEDADFEKIELIAVDTEKVTFLRSQKRYQIYVAQSGEDFFAQIGAKSARFTRLSRLPEPLKALAKGAYNAPMPGEVVKILVESGQKIVAGAPLLVINSMKMENTMYAHSAGQIEEIYVQEKKTVKAGDRLLKVNEDA
ncbi:MAG: ATP-grasp domain-containing protein [Microscillaceae bacterium]|jgi:acetyl-CoA carboxylase biotin carboxylase subunit|nr:ATP-grasp domain-containing protein [Microscillaceae bacterium]